MTHGSFGRSRLTRRRCWVPTGQKALGLCGRPGRGIFTSRTASHPSCMILNVTDNTTVVVFLISISIVIVIVIVNWHDCDLMSQRSAMQCTCWPTSRLRAEQTPNTKIRAPLSSAMITAVVPPWRSRPSEYQNLLPARSLVGHRRRRAKDKSILTSARPPCGKPATAFFTILSRSVDRFAGADLRARSPTPNL